MKKLAQQIAKKYTVDYNQLIGRGKSHQVQAAKRELIYELLSGGNDVNDETLIVLRETLRRIDGGDEGKLG